MALMTTSSINTPPIQPAASPTLYVITAYKFNHIERPQPIDPSLFNPALNAIFYFVDTDGAPPGFTAPHMNEADLNPAIMAAGKAHLAEWTFLLTELERAFAKYPFYVVSSRFPEKNTSLHGGLADVWHLASESLNEFGWGYLPSYNRPANFQDMVEYLARGRLGMREEGIAFVDGFWGVRIPDEYRYVSDFFCNYIGFKSREHFERYMAFYLPFIRRFFAPDWTLIRNPELYVRRRDVFRAEKPFTLLLELISHMFFYLHNIPFGGLSYDGLYRVDERNSHMECIKRHSHAAHSA
jgi:hypothetical protein